MSFRITEMYAFVALDGDDDCEGIPAIDLAGTAYPLVAADRERAESLRPYAQEIARSRKMRIELRRFTAMTTVEAFEP